MIAPVTHFASATATATQPLDTQMPTPAIAQPIVSFKDVTKRYGRGSIGLGHAGIRGGPDWTMKRDMLSPRYTTHWDELPLVKAA